jgi:hypothetical protein
MGGTGLIWLNEVNPPRSEELMSSLRGGFTRTRAAPRFGLEVMGVGRGYMIEVRLH